MRLQPFFVVGLLALTCFTAAAPAAEPFQVKAGDVWVMAGDSITAQRQHSNYIEAYYRTRYPNLKVQFRNSGVGGHTTGSTLARFDYDLAAFKPTIISIELGMNDVGAGDDPARYIAGMQKLLASIRAVKATPVLISSSPVNDGSKMDDWKSDRCRRIHPYTDALAKLAAEEKVVMVDQYHPLIKLWHENRNEDNTQKLSLGGDPVHPGPVGQYTMAAAILAGLGAEKEVSSATLDADGKVVDAKQCKISDVKAGAGSLSFTRLDERSPWPVPTACKTALQVLPSIADQSRYLLQVNGLAAGDYSVSLNGKEVAKVTAEQLAAGWNIATAGEAATGERGQQIVALIGKLQGPANNAFRTASKANDVAVKAKDEAKIAETQKAIAEAQAAIDALETELAALCQPQPIAFEIKGVK
ncbi:multifunctional acyl-CoA thioesterase I and protease I and lysophospholipase L1 [Anatilimnocola aggregata]|uniref:Multifunctional acyl-CoA thioesterase I and protease I and lysophospholipase L1 n=1 Tax=Anatilimnocola aggregata TaxID=2528021 RepID=A0A517YLE4_9BACT|nr:SGNH/GDSL hydrolase family protein [Anatilimnocola aggregata]QDU31055.1 multifunctional acyl-CoA thioesterase I and protease I and lysophospholipase L1 [Anatilimnocola aggregata]